MFDIWIWVGHIADRRSRVEHEPGPFEALRGNVWLHKKARKYGVTSGGTLWAVDERREECSATERLDHEDCTT